MDHHWNRPVPERCAWKGCECGGFIDPEAAPNFPEPPASRLEGLAVFTFNSGGEAASLFFSLGFAELKPSHPAREDQHFFFDGAIHGTAPSGSSIEKESTDPPKSAEPRHRFRRGDQPWSIGLFDHGSGNELAGQRGGYMTQPQ